MYRVVPSRLRDRSILEVAGSTGRRWAAMSRAAALCIPIVVCCAGAQADELQTCLDKGGAAAVDACGAIIQAKKVSGAELEKVYLARALVEQKLRQYQQAIADFGEALKTGPTNLDALRGRGNTFFELGQFDNAIRDYQRAVEVNPKYVPVLYNLGLAYSAVRDFEQATAFYTTALQVDPRGRRRH